MNVILAPSTKRKGVVCKYKPPPELKAELLMKVTLAPAAMFSSDPYRNKAPSSRSMLLAKRILPDNVMLLLKDVATLPIRSIKYESPPIMTVLFCISAHLEVIQQYPSSMQNSKS